MIISTMFPIVRIIGTPIFDPRYSDRIMGSNRLLCRRYSDEVLVNEMIVVPTQEDDLLFDCFTSHRKDEVLPVQVKPIGYSDDLRVYDFRFFAFVKGNYRRAFENSPDVRDAERKLRQYFKQKTNASIVSKISEGQELPSL